MDTKTLLSAIGGQAKVARECGISSVAVSHWAKDDFIPSARLQYLRLAHPGKHWALYGEHQAAKSSVAI